MSAKTETEKILAQDGWARVTLSGKTLGYAPEHNDTYFSVWIPTNALHCVVDDDGSWSIHQGGGLAAGDNCEDLDTYLDDQRGQEKKAAAAKRREAKAGG